MEAIALSIIVMSTALIVSAFAVTLCYVVYNFIREDIETNRKYREKLKRYGC